MTLQERIKDDMVKAMKAKDQLKTGILRVVMSDFARIKTGADKKITDDQALKCIRTAYNGAEEMSHNPFHKSKSEAEMKVLESYLPTMLSEEHIEGIVSGVMRARGWNDMSCMGKLMGEVKKHPDGKRIDGKLASSIVKRLLSS